MGKSKALILVAAAACTILAGTSTSAGEYIRSAAVFAAGTGFAAANSDKEIPADSPAVPAEPSAEPTTELPAQSSSEKLPQNNDETADAAAETSQSSRLPPTTPQTTSVSAAESLSPPESGRGEVITQNSETVAEDLSGFDNNDGDIIRESYGNSLGADHITLSSGAQVRNMTDISAQELTSAAEQLPQMRVDINSSEPLVLIVHTHTTEDYEPTARDFYDENFPTRTLDSAQNVCAVGEEIAQALAARGISVVHDCTVHDYPAYTGAYDRSEETIKKALSDYPSIKIVIDLHRDATENSQGQRIAPVAEINGKNAAQFMIIAGCDNGLFNMPDYIENFKLACLIQNTAQELYAGLARPVLFDYRNYNQHLTTGSLLIEVGSHANSLDEAKYTGQLLGEILAQTLEKIRVQ